MDRKRIAILYGGKSGEHDVSRLSAASVLAHLDTERYEPILIGITEEGVWYLQEHAKSGLDGLRIETASEMIVGAVPGRGFTVRGAPLPADFVFPVLHGTFGEDGTVQGLLELVESPYAGAGVLPSALGMNKGFAKRLWRDAGLPVVPFIEVRDHEVAGDLSGVEAVLERCIGELKLPLFVKPASAGSSVGVSKVTKRGDLLPAIRIALHHDSTALVEPAIRGKEIECSVIGTSSPESFTPGEIVPTHEFYSYEAKYIDPEGAVLRVPADIDGESMRNIRVIAEKAYGVLGVDGMARVDFFLEDGTGAILLNEINTIPGFTSISMFSRMCEASGLSYAALLEELIDIGIERFAASRRKSYDRDRDHQ